MSIEEKNKNLELKIKSKNKAVARYFRKTVSELYSLIQDYELPYKLNVELDSNSDFWTEEFTQVHQINYSKKI